MRTKNLLRALGPLSAAALFLSAAVSPRANDIEAGKDVYNAIPPKQPTVTIDGSLADWDSTRIWSGVQFAIPKGSGATGSYVTFEEYGGGTWSGPDDQTVGFSVTWDADNLYIGVVVTDEYHINTSGSAWNGDSLQMMITDASKSAYALYDVALGGTDEDISGGTPGTLIVLNEQNITAGTDAAVVRDPVAHTTTYELAIPATSLTAIGFTKFTDGMKLGLALCVNDGDADATGQAGWGGWGAHAIVFGKTASEAGLVALRSAANFIDVASVSPADKAGNVPDTSGIEADLTENGIGIKNGSIGLKLNGATVTPVITRNGSAVTVKYQPATALQSPLTYTAELTYQDANNKSFTKTWSFTTQGKTAIYAGMAKAQLWFNIGGTAVDALTSDPRYPDSPDRTLFTSFLEYPSGDANGSAPPGNVFASYGWKISGLLTPKDTGDYIFAMASDDNGQFWLSTDDKPANLAEVANEPQWNPVRAFASTTRRPGCDAGDCENVTTPIHLEGGKSYYYEAIAKEGGGGDNLAVAWVKDDGSGSGPADGAVPIGAEFLSVLADTLAVTSDPVDTTVPENSPASFTVSATQTPGLKYQWQVSSGGGAFADIAGATSATYTFTTAPADQGKKYRAHLTSAGNGDVTSKAATLTVIADTTVPTIVSADTFVDRTSIVVRFSEGVNGDQGTYTLDGGATVTSVEKLSPTSYLLHLGAPLKVATDYSLTVAGVHDNASGAGNPVTPNNLHFTSAIAAPAGTFEWGKVIYERWEGVSGDLAGFEPEIASRPPDASGIMPLFESPVNVAESYGGRLRGYFVPPQTTDYIFYMASDDHGWMYLSTDSDPANKKLIAKETAWSNQRQWLASGGGSDNSAKDSSRFVDTEWPDGNKITLIGGQKYYIELLWVEGGGGDNGNATFRTSVDGGPGQDNISVIGGHVIGNYIDEGAPSGPSITKKPTGKAFNSGDTVTLSVEATGSAPLHYTWYQNKVEIPNNDSPTLTIAGANYNAVGDYYVKVSNDLGSVTSLPDDTARLLMNGAFTIEAGDYNYDGGKHIAAADVMPYSGGAYQGLNGTPDVDYFTDNEGAGASNAYGRNATDTTEFIPTKGPADPADYKRGDFSVNVNYVVGWTDTGEWQNYTRKIPAGKYVVIGSMAHDGLADGEINMFLSKVDKPTLVDDATAVDGEGGSQQIHKLGQFLGQGTGAWSSNDFFPLRDDAGNIAKIDFDGSEVTLRHTFNNTDGDFDYYLLYKIDGPSGPSLNVTEQSPTGATGHADSAIVGVITENGLTYKANSAALKVNGQAVTPTITRNGSKVTVSYQPASPLDVGASYTVDLTYMDSANKSYTQSWSFSVSAGSGSFLIELEDFNYLSGKTLPEASVMPYLGNAYVGLPATQDIDYHVNDDIQDGGAQFYRVGDRPNNPITSNADYDRGAWTQDYNYRIGWADPGEWWNYTRTIPAGNYTVLAALSHGDINATMRASLSIVTSDPTKNGQTAAQLGTFTAPATGGWGSNALVPMQDNGQDTVIHLGGTQTLRFNSNSGDVDYFFLVPTTKPAAPPIATVDVRDGQGLYSKATLGFNITDIGRAPATGIKLMVDGVDQTSSAVITDTVAGATVSYGPNGGFAGGVHNYTLSFGGQTLTGSFRVITDAFTVEAEDFNYDGGKSNPKAGTAGQDVNVMPYSGGAYDGLGAVFNVDYNHNDGSSDVYRKGENPPVPLNDNTGDNVRGSFNLSVNYKIGWIGPDRWFNYTRTLPAGEYAVYAGLSFGDTQPNQLKGKLSLVGNPTVVDPQTLTDLGTFTGAGTGGWGANVLVPMDPPTVTTDGASHTVRFTAQSGDFDYLLFVPTAVVAPKPHLTITDNGNDTVTVKWTNGGTLEVADNVEGPYTSTGDSSGSRTVSATVARKFWRVKR